MSSATQEIIHKAKLITRTLVAKNTFELSFLVEGDFNFEPGQYIWLELPTLHYEDPAGSRRAMSIVNAPEDINVVTVLMRAGKSGYKKTIAELNPDDKVTIHGPFGSAFSLLEKNTRPLVMLAGGVGIAPFMSLVSANTRAPKRSIMTLIATNESPKESPYMEQLEDMNKFNTSKELTVNYLHRNLKLSDLKEIEKYDKAIYYVAGPQLFVNKTSELLASIGIEVEQIKYENFHPQSSKTLFLAKLLRHPKQQYKVENTDNDFLSMQEGDVLMSALESSTNHIIITDINGEIVFANDAACKTTGYTFEEMVGNTPRLWGGLMSKEFYKKLWDSKKLGNTIDEKLTNRRKDGSLYQVMAHISPIRSHAGEVIGFIGTEEDISDIVAAEEEAKNSRDRLSQVTDNIQEVFRLTDLSGASSNVEYSNPALRTIFGITQEQLYKNPDLWVKCIHPDDREKFVAEHKKAEESGKPLNLRYRVVNKKDGTIRWVENKTKLIRDSEGNPWRLVGVTRDITKEIEVDKEKTEFVSLASHQLRTPLTAINWYVELLESEQSGDLNKNQKAYLGEVGLGSKRMVKLVNSLLNISRIETGRLKVEPVELDLTSLVNAILHELDPLAGEHSCRLVLTEPKEKLQKLKIDEDLVRQVVLNLATNALRYSSANQCDVEVKIYKDGEEMVISVSNDGIGIPKSDQAKIFDKFFRADNARNLEAEGSGMGLYLAKIIAEQSGTRIWFKSPTKHDRAGKKTNSYGTTFFYSIPLSGMKPHGGEKTIESTSEL